MKLVSIPVNPVPEGAIVGALKTCDGVELRYARWDSEAESRGTVCLLQGRAEFIEKYFETVRELRGRGFAVVAFDWRGQGASERALPDRRKGHVESFQHYEMDLQTVMTEVALPNCRGPFVCLAHSMGAAIALRSAASGRRDFDGMVLTAPMIGLPRLMSSPLFGAASLTMRACGLGKAYIPGGRGTLMDLKPFAGNWRTSDFGRYSRNAEIVATEPELGLGAPTIAWTNAALDVMRQFADPAYPRRINERLLIVAAGQDKITSTPASAIFASRSTGSHLVIADARHEVLMEKDGCRTQFWSAFDSFVG